MTRTESWPIGYSGRAPVALAESHVRVARCRSRLRVVIASSSRVRSPGQPLRTPLKTQRRSGV